MAAKGWSMFFLQSKFEGNDGRWFERLDLRTRKDFTADCKISRFCPKSGDFGLRYQTNYFISVGMEVVSNSLISPVTTKTVRSQMLVTRSAMRSRLCAAHRSRLARSMTLGS